MARHRPTQPLLFVVFWRITPQLTGVREHGEERTMLLAMGLIGRWLDRIWGCMLLAVALGITVYWPVVCLATFVGARDAAGWNLTGEAAYWVVLPLFVL